MDAFWAIGEKGESANGCQESQDFSVAL